MDLGADHIERPWKTFMSLIFGLGGFSDKFYRNCSASHLNKKSVIELPPLKKGD
ncbi:MAG: hypothetical protein RL563_1919 [Pseudomonadota bacterium]